MKSIIMVLVILSMSVSFAEDPIINLLTVKVEKSRLVEPDLAIISLGLKQRTKTIGSEQERMNGIISSFKSSILAWVDKGDIKTKQFKVNEVKKWDQNSKESRLTGYEITNILQINLRDINKLGQVVDKAIDFGFNYFGGVQFDFSERDKVEETLLYAAIGEAALKAKKMAKAASVSLGTVHYLEEISNSHRPRSSHVETMSLKSFSPSNFESGELLLKSTVRVDYLLR
jgi:uncharacterized protein